MIVTDLQYSLEDKLVKKLDLMIARCTQKNPKRDALLINEGGEGEGKTNSSIAEAYYVKYKTKREAHLFFKLKPMIDFALSTENKIIIWDEPSLDSLTTDHFTEINRDLKRLFMTARKKRHFYIINMTKFYKFDEYIQVDRALGMIHMYSRKEIHPGRFWYIKKKNLEALRRAYSSTKLRLYKKFKTFGGNFPNIMEKHFDKMDFHINGVPHATYKLYESEKDKAILSIGTKEQKITKREVQYRTRLLELRKKIGIFAEKMIIPISQLSRITGIDENRLRDWRYIDINDIYSLDSEENQQNPTPSLKNGNILDDNPDKSKDINK